MKHNKWGARLEKHQQREKKMKTSLMFRFSLSFRCVRMRKTAAAVTEPGGPTVASLSCSECRGQWAADNIPCLRTHLQPIRLSNMCPSPPKKKVKRKKQTEAGGGNDGTTEGSAVDWIVRLMASLCLRFSAHINDCLMTL